MGPASRTAGRWCLGNRSMFWGPSGIQLHPKAPGAGGPGPMCVIQFPQVTIKRDGAESETTHGFSCTVENRPLTTIGAIKAKIQDLVNVDKADQQRWIFAGHDGEVDDSRTLSSYSLFDHADVLIITKDFVVTYLYDLDN